MCTYAIVETMVVIATGRHPRWFNFFIVDASNESANIQLVNAETFSFWIAIGAVDKRTHIDKKNIIWVPAMFYPMDEECCTPCTGIHTNSHTHAEAHQHIDMHTRKSKFILSKRDEVYSAEDTRTHTCTCTCILTQIKPTLTLTLTQTYSQQNTERKRERDCVWSMNLNETVASEREKNLFRGKNITKSSLVGWPFLAAFSLWEKLCNFAFDFSMVKSVVRCKYLPTFRS